MGRGLAAHRYQIIFLGCYLARRLGGSPAVPTLLRLWSTARAAVPNEVRHEGIAVVYSLVDLVGGVSQVNEWHSSFVSGHKALAFRISLRPDGTTTVRLVA